MPCPYYVLLHRASIGTAVCLAALLVACTPTARSSSHEAPGESSAATPYASGTTRSDVDLAVRARANGLRVVGTTATVLDDGRMQGVRLADRGAYRGQVMAWLDDVMIGDGVIELDIRGKDVFQQSFPGIAFRAATDSAFEVVYLRPFNFRAADTLRRQHAVQYMSLPDFDFERLRKERPEEFENPVDRAPDPNDWVHLRVVLAGPRVSIFVGEGAEPDLVVDALNRRPVGRIGLFNPGDFANLRVARATSP